MDNNPGNVDFYARPTAFTQLSGHADLVANLPRELSELAAALRNILLNEHAAWRYDVALTPEARESGHLRPAQLLLDKIIESDPRPLLEPRAAQDRVVGHCRQFAVLTVAVLRSRGIPARVRVGFSGYIVPPFFEDHWITEYWDAPQRRWRLYDSQLDNAMPGAEPVGFDPTDVPRDSFVVAADAWQRCRAGQADPQTFGFSLGRMTGFWFIAGSLLRDLAALNKVELLPWDGWGAMPFPDQRLSEEQFELFDELADMTRDPHRHFARLSERYRQDERLHAPAKVHNHLRGIEEEI